jgi:hypothetical protein
MGWFYHTWRFVYDPDTTTSKILKLRNYPNTYFWNATIVTKIHLFWSAILNIKKHLEKMLPFILLMAIHVFGINHGDLFRKSCMTRLNLEQSDFEIPNKVSSLWLPN